MLPWFYSRVCFILCMQIPPWFYRRFVLHFVCKCLHGSTVCFILCMQMPPWFYSQFVLYFVCKCLHGSTASLFYILYANASMVLQKVCFTLCMQMPPWFYSQFVLHFVCKCFHGSTGLFYTLYANAPMVLQHTSNCRSGLAISKSHSFSIWFNICGFSATETRLATKTNNRCGPVTLLPKTVLFYIKHSWYSKYQQNTN